jgi:hypothetical protein
MYNKNLQWKTDSENKIIHDECGGEVETLEIAEREEYLRCKNCGWFAKRDDFGDDEEYDYMNELDIGTIEMINLCAGEEIF